MCSTNVPDRMVSCSSLVCQCPGILYPSGILRRIVKGAFFEGSPWSTAIFAPLGMVGGASPHFRSAASRNTASDFGADFFLSWSARDAAVVARRAMAMAGKRRFMIVFPLSLCGCRINDGGDPGDRLCGKACAPSVLQNDLGVRSDVDAVEPVLGDVAVDPLDGGAELAQNAV